MPIRFSCQYCDAVMKVPDSAAGKQGTCPTCKRTITAPMTSVSEPSITLIQPPVEIQPMPIIEIETQSDYHEPLNNPEPMSNIPIMKPSLKFCTGCGSPLLPESHTCGMCGLSISTNRATAPPPPISHTNRYDEINIWQVFLAFISNPIGGIQKAFDSMPGSQVISTGLIFSSVYIILFMMGLSIFKRSHSMLMWFTMQFMTLGIDYDNLFVGAILSGVIIIGSFLFSSIIVRFLFKGEGTFEGNIFLTGTVLLPSGIFIFLLSIISNINSNIISLIVLIMFMFMLGYTFFALYGGLKNILKIQDYKLTYSLPVILSIWSIMLLVIFWVANKANNHIR